MVQLELHTFGKQVIGVDVVRLLRHVRTVRLMVRRLVQCSVLKTALVTSLQTQIVEVLVLPLAKVVQELRVRGNVDNQLLGVRSRSLITKFWRRLWARSAATVGRGACVCTATFWLLCPVIISCRPAVV